MHHMGWTWPRTSATEKQVCSRRTHHLQWCRRRRPLLSFEAYLALSSASWTILLRSSHWGNWNLSQLKCILINTRYRYVGHFFRIRSRVCFFSVSRIVVFVCSSGVIQFHILFWVPPPPSTRIMSQRLFRMGSVLGSRVRKALERKAPVAGKGVDFSRMFRTLIAYIYVHIYLYTFLRIFFRFTCFFACLLLLRCFVLSSGYFPARLFATKYRFILFYPVFQIWRRDGISSKVTKCTFGKDKMLENKERCVCAHAWSRFCFICWNGVLVALL